MNLPMRRLILIAALVSLPVAGGEVYKCTGPKGEITFTNIKCPAHTDTEHYSTYEAEPEPQPAATIPVEAVSPTGATVNSADPVDAPVAPTGAISIAPSAQPSTSPLAQPAAPSEPASAVSAPAAGYKCAEGGNVWLQSTPCPQVTTQSTSRPNESFTAAGARVAATADAMPAAANSQATSQGPLCDQLIAQTASSVRPKDGVGSDELNKLLAANRCKR